MSEQTAVRETLQNNRPLAVGLAGALLATAVAIAVGTRGDHSASNLSQLYYSDDDGRTWFTAGVDRIPPFDHDGRRAYQAMVYRAGGGTPFVGYLLGYTDAGARRLAELCAAPRRGDVDAEITRVRDASLIVKKPGEPAWHTVPSAAAVDDLTPTPPPGQIGRLEPVTPE